jgi:hypothetical protein
MAILRSDFQRTCSIDIETDSTVIADLQAEQDSMAKIMQSVMMIGQGAQGLLATGVVPPPEVMMLSLEFMKLAIHAGPNNRGAMELITAFQEKLEQMPPPMPMMPPMGPPGAAPPEAGPPPGAGVPPPGNGAAPIEAKLKLPPELFG